MIKLVKPPVTSLAEPLPQGPFPARLVIYADLGVRETPWGKKAEVGLGVEVYVEKAANGQSILVPEVMTRSLSEKSKLSQYLVAILGRVPSECDAHDLLGGTMLVTLASKKGAQNVYFPQIASVTALPSELPAPAAQSPLLVFDLDHPDPQVFAALPRLHQKIIRDALSHAQKAPLHASRPSLAGSALPPQAGPPAAGNPFPHLTTPPGGQPPVAASPPVIPANPFAPPAGGVVPAGETAKAPVENPFEGDSGSEAWWNDLAEAVHARRNNPFN